ncbi:hypothetical protein B0H14DRAFT_1022023 [Mycena olivaceomarginata]|nr:hypothetical protein B0H14DRAFT_1022023 [Mycena olivaceomarginata]
MCEHLLFSPPTLQRGLAGDSRHAERNRQADVPAAPAALCALINLVSGQVSGSGNTTDAGNGWLTVGIISNCILPKLYAMSAMWTLNSRNAIRLAGGNGQTTSSGNGPGGGRRRANNVEFIQVRTQVQTMQRTDDIVFSKSHVDAMEKMDAERDIDSTMDLNRD